MLFPTLLTLLLANEPADVHARDEFTDMNHGLHEAHFSNLLGVKAVGVADLRTSRGLVGVGAVYEHTLIERWLELEVSGIFLHGKEAILIPIDLLLKKPFHVTHVFNPFIGAGGALVFVIEGRRKAFFGAVASAGTYLWSRRNLGLLIEFDYAVIAEQGVAHEFEGAVGLAYRF